MALHVSIPQFTIIVLDFLLLLLYLYFIVREFNFTVQKTKTRNFMQGVRSLEDKCNLQIVNCLHKSLFGILYRIYTVSA